MITQTPFAFSSNPQTFRASSRSHKCTRHLGHALSIVGLLWKVIEVSYLIMQHTKFEG